LEFDIGVVDGEHEQAGCAGLRCFEGAAAAAGCDSGDGFEVKLAIFGSSFGGMAFEAVLLEEWPDGAFEEFSLFHSRGRLQWGLESVDGSKDTGAQGAKAGEHYWAAGFYRHAAPEVKASAVMDPVEESELFESISKFFAGCIIEC
jgi:hypothetical protein